MEDFTVNLYYYFDKSTKRKAVNTTAKEDIFNWLSIIY
jgi:hypothetical protein